MCAEDLIGQTWLNCAEAYLFLFGCSSNLYCISLINVMLMVNSTANAKSNITRVCIIESSSGFRLMNNRNPTPLFNKWNFFFSFLRTSTLMMVLFGFRLRQGFSSRTVLWYLSRDKHRRFLFSKERSVRFCYGS